MFLRTTVFLCVLALAQAVPMNPVRLVISPHINSSTKPTVWHCGDRVTMKWDTSRIPAEGDFPGMLVLGHLAGDSEYLDVDHPLAQDFPLRAGSVEFTVPDVNLVGSNYIVVLFGDSGDASPQFMIKSRSKLVKKAPQESDPSEEEPDLPDESDPLESPGGSDPFFDDPDPFPDFPEPNPAGSNYNGVPSFAQHIHHTGTIALCVAMSLILVM